MLFGLVLGFRLRQEWVKIMIFQLHQPTLTMPSKSSTSKATSFTPSPCLTRCSPISENTKELGVVKRSLIQPPCWLNQDTVQAKMLTFGQSANLCRKTMAISYMRYILNSKSSILFRSCSWEIAVRLNTPLPHLRPHPQRSRLRPLRNPSPRL